MNKKRSASSDFYSKVLPGGSFYQKDPDLAEQLRLTGNLQRLENHSGQVLLICPECYRARYILRVPIPAMTCPHCKKKSATIDVIRLSYFGRNTIYFGYMYPKAHSGLPKKQQGKVSFYLAPPDIIWQALGAFIVEQVLIKGLAGDSYKQLKAFLAEFWKKRQKSLKRQKLSKGEAESHSIENILEDEEALDFLVRHTIDYLKRHKSEFDEVKRYEEAEIRKPNTSPAVKRDSKKQARW